MDANNFQFIPWPGMHKKFGCSNYCYQLLVGSSHASMHLICTVCLIFFTRSLSLFQTWKSPSMISIRLHPQHPYWESTGVIVRKTQVSPCTCNGEVLETARTLSWIFINYAIDSIFDPGRFLIKDRVAG